MIYVDDLYKYPTGRFGRMKMSHLIADTVDELFGMAKCIGIATKWAQGSGADLHFDIALSKRKLAIEHGAIPITWRQCGMMIANRRATGELGTPDTAEAVFKQRWRENQKRKKGMK